MEVIDIIILILIGVGVIQGLMKGSIKQLAAIAGFVAGLLLARALFGTVAQQLAPALGTSITIAQILSFILIWVAVPIGCSLVASVLTKALDVINLGWLNRLAGKFNVDLYTDRPHPDLMDINCRGTVDYYEDMPKVFNQSKINMNFTIRNIRSGIPLRVWDVLGAGGFLLTNFQAELPAYFDNGKDYTAKGFSTPFISSDNSEHSIFKELGVKMVNSLCYNGRAKTIERFLILKIFYFLRKIQLLYVIMLS